MLLLGRRTWGKELRESITNPLSSLRPSGKSTLSTAAFGIGILFIWDAVTCRDWPQGCQRESPYVAHSHTDDMISQ